MRDVSEAVCWHSVPRLDSPDKWGVLPVPVLRWLGGGLCCGPVYGQIVWLLGGVPLADVWSQWAPWLVTLCGLLVGSVGAFVRPQGLHLGQWASAVVAYALVPRRLVWCPIVERGKG